MAPVVEKYNKDIKELEISRKVSILLDRVERLSR
jgi:hypothetical protein